MTGDTKYSGSMSNESKITGSITGDNKNLTKVLATEALDFLITEDNNFIATSLSGIMDNDTKY